MLQGALGAPPPSAHAGQIAAYMSRAHRQPAITESIAELRRVPCPRLTEQLVQDVLYMMLVFQVGRRPGQLTVQSVQALLLECFEDTPYRLGVPSEMPTDQRRRPASRREEHHLDPFPEPPWGVRDATGFPQPCACVLIDFYPKHPEGYNIYGQVLRALAAA